MSYKQGLYFESIARRYLEHLGKFGFEKNVNFLDGEIDLIHIENRYITFYEVKSLNSHSEMYIYETLTRRKRKRLLGAIKKYIHYKRYYEFAWQLDFIGIVNRGEIYEVEHFENVEL